MLVALYQGTMSAVRVDGDLSNWFQTVVGGWMYLATIIGVDVDLARSSYGSDTRRQ